jgi:hypothetical protein
MSRLILIPQYPAKLRYQEWWHRKFPIELSGYFDEVVSISGYDKDIVDAEMADAGEFSSASNAIKWELNQIHKYMEMVIHEDDKILLNDLSFPGLFANVLFHKRPGNDNIFAICHATSKNEYDLFSLDVVPKYGVEESVAKLFTKIFVATEYHKNKLGWDNIEVIPFPLPTVNKYTNNPRRNLICSVARDTFQKRTKHIEDSVEKYFGTTIVRRDSKSWEEYYDLLQTSKILIITSKEETYGYQVIEAVMNGCIPVAPYDYSYPELLPKKCLYRNFRELISIIDKIIKGEITLPNLKVYDQAEKFYNNIFYSIMNENK